MIVGALDRYWAKVDRQGDDECWPWTGSMTLGGYGQLSNGSRKRGRALRSLATHIALAIDGRFRPDDGYVAMHSCDNPRCVNPRHLRWGTVAENRADMLAKGRSAAQVRAAEEMDKSAGRLGGKEARRKLSEEAVRYIRASSKGTVPLGRELGVSRSLISMVRLGQAYDDVA